jgi:ribosome-binding factor A
MKEFSRNQRVGVQIQRELANILRREITDPKLGMLTISSVDVSPDLKSARVYITVFGSEKGIAHSIQSLNKVTGRLRYHLSQCLMTRTTPRLQFIHDRTIEDGSRLSALIDSVAPHRTEEDG